MLIEDKTVMAAETALGWSQNFDLTYRLGKAVGAGTHARVHVAHSRTTKHLVAVKMIPKTRRGRPRKLFIQKEFDMLVACQGHSNIVKFEDMFETTDSAMILTEFLAGGDLWQNVQRYGPYQEKDVRQIMQGLLEAVKHCHDRHILVGDLKSTNVMLRIPKNPATATLIDFGGSRNLAKNERISRWSGTPLFLPPESIPSTGYQSFLSDIYSAGVTMSNIATGQIPQITQPEPGKWIIAVPRQLGNFSQEAHDLLASLLEEDSSRPNADEALQHSWFC